jgi:hypothetical protein
MKFDRIFRLSERRGQGVSCSKEGLFVGDTPLLEEVQGGGRVVWRVRPQSQLDPELSKSYGVALDFGAKMSGVAGVARALADGDLALAQIAALLLQLPDPPLSKKGEAPLERLTELAGQLQSSGLMKVDWDPKKHPRWSAGSSEGVGGQFAPADSDEATAGANASIIPAQISIPLDVPARIPFRLPLQLPSEIAPPLVTPILPRSLPQNPYPSRPECVKEWAEAEEFCRDLQRRGLLGRGDYRWMGKTLAQCVMGQVSEACGGNPDDIALLRIRS